MTTGIVPFPRSPTKREALSIVRAAAADTGRIGWSDHARARMEERNVAMRQAPGTLRNGRIVSGPALDGYGEWRVRLQKHSAGRLVRVAVAIKEDGRNLTVVTVI